MKRILDEITWWLGMLLAAAAFVVAVYGLATTLFK